MKSNLKSMQMMFQLQYVLYSRSKNMSAVEGKSPTCYMLICPRRNRKDIVFSVLKLLTTLMAEKRAKTFTSMKFRSMKKNNKCQAQTRITHGRKG